MAIVMDFSATVVLVSLTTVLTFENILKDTLV